MLNAAGPFTYTAAPVMEAALRMRTPYIDVVAEPGIAAAAFDNYQGRARDAGIVIAPAAAFYRGLGSLARGYADGNALPTSALVAATREIAHAASAGCR